MDDSRPLSPSVVKARRPDVKLIKRCWIQCNLFFFNLLPISSPIQGTFLSLPNQLSFFFFFNPFLFISLRGEKVPNKILDQFGRRRTKNRGGIEKI